MTSSATHCALTMECNPPWRVLGRSSLCGGFDCCEQLRELAELSALVIELLVLSDLTLFTDEPVAAECRPVD